MMNREARTQQDRGRRLGPVLGGSLACLALLATQVTAARGASPRTALTTPARSTCVPLTIDRSLVPDQMSALTGSPPQRCATPTGATRRASAS